MNTCEICHDLSAGGICSSCNAELGNLADEAEQAFRMLIWTAGGDERLAIGYLESDSVLLNDPCRQFVQAFVDNELAELFDDWGIPQIANLLRERLTPTGEDYDTLQYAAGQTLKLQQKQLTSLEPEWEAV